IKTTLSRYNVSRAIAHGFNIVLCGETNVGKSSLFNKLVGSNRAIVSDIAGTTRDVISAQIDIDGYLVNLSDTAGIRDTGDEIENMGIDRTKLEIDSADLVLHIFADDNVATPMDKEIIVINKSDEIKTRNNKNAIYTSAKNDTGIDELLSAIRKKMHSILDGAENNLVINARTYKLLADTEHELDSALTTFDGNYDIFAEHVRRAADNIGKILGTITATDVMDATFSQLCLGK
ncbi:MAG: 50S ribosome-binding GTPase, partial [Alphaproteobacteria bacterium]|nr:50S ribosome-binding GTPase [Alphaproteobacteria bacterium]